MKNIDCINIIPARFLEKRDDGKYLIRVLLNDENNESNNIQDRIFDNYSLNGMINPDYIFISIVTGENILRVDFFDANKFKKIFDKKWKTLTK
jgi:hypothetical protein